MNKFHYLLAGLLSIFVLSSFAAPKVEKDGPKRVYMYGVSVDFNDSVVYLTDVQYLDSIVINKDGSLLNYSSYSHQFKMYLEGTLGEDNQTCAVVYSDNKKNLEKRFVKIRKRYLSDKEKVLRRVGADAFVFRKE
jgi:hypothetical protein